MAGNKVAGLRLFEDAGGKMNLALEDGAAARSSSPVYALRRRQPGRRPSFSHAAPPEQAEPLVEAFIAGLRDAGLTVATGRFGAMMEVIIHNDGPVTLLVER